MRVASAGPSPPARQSPGTHAQQQLSDWLQERQKRGCVQRHRPVSQLNPGSAILQQHYLQGQLSLTFQIRIRQEYAAHN